MAQAFISWSGTQARAKAKALRGLYEDVIPEATVFMSDEDIALGSVWLDTVAGSLDSSIAGVIIVTPENIKSPWVHYEAGALATRVERRMVVPLLSGVTPEDLANTPLSIFQATAISKESILAVALQFARALGSPRGDPALTRAFEKWWDDYEQDLLAAPSATKSPAPSLPDIHQLLNGLQAQARNQAESIARLTHLVEGQVSRALAAATSPAWMQSITPPAGWEISPVNAAGARATNSAADQFARALGVISDTATGNAARGTKVTSMAADELSKALGLVSEAVTTSVNSGPKASGIAAAISQGNLSASVQKSAPASSPSGSPPTKPGGKRKS